MSPRSLMPSAVVLVTPPTIRSNRTFLTSSCPKISGAMEFASCKTSGQGIFIRARAWNGGGRYADGKGSHPGVNIPPTVGELVGHLAVLCTCVVVFVALLVLQDPHRLQIRLREEAGSHRLAR